MLKSIITTSALLLCSIGFASAVVDPELFKTTNAQSPRFRAILIFKDKAPVNYLSGGNRIYPMVRRALERNSEASQTALLNQLRNESTLAAPIYTHPLWILNGMIIDAPKTMLTKLVEHPDVRAIYANREMHIIQPYFHGRVNPALAQPGFTDGLKVMNIPALRQAKPNLTGEGVNVGILDTGIDAAHKDLAGKVVIFKDFVGKKSAAYDDHGHGTHVAGTIAGGNTSGTSIGVAPNTKLTVAKVFSSSGSASTAEILAAMQWMADPDNNPQTKDQPALVSNSWGGGSPSASKSPADDAFCMAVETWIKLGIMPVFAAGNSGSGKGTVNIPGACPAALAVGATDFSDVIASFSSRGPAVWKTGSVIKPLVSAPGVKILSSMPGGGYGTMSGTSMATPHTSGLLSLIYQAVPGISIEQASALIVKGVKDLGPAGQDNDYGFGRIDAMSTLAK